MAFGFARRRRRFATAGGMYQPLTLFHYCEREVNRFYTLFAIRNLPLPRTVLEELVRFHKQECCHIKVTCRSERYCRPCYVRLFKTAPPEDTNFRLEFGCRAMWTHYRLSYCCLLCRKPLYIRPDGFEKLKCLCDEIQSADLSAPSQQPDRPRDGT